MFDALIWKIQDRPGYFGKHRDQRHKEYDEAYGPGSWQIGWAVNDLLLCQHEAVLLYEDAYWQFLDRNPYVLDRVVSEARNVYDDAESNVLSEFDYSRQETARTHLQDIAIRRCLLRFVLWFRGDDLIQIRDKAGSHPLSMTLSPGRVPFHLPNLILPPQLGGWWQPSSVESFYQSNKVLLVKG